MNNESTPPAATPVKTGKGETILIIEDEPSVRNIFRLFLEFSGYQAISAEDGIEGLAIYRQNHHLVKVVITDIRLPMMHGAEVINKLREINPEARIIAVSGMAEGTSQIIEEPGRLVFLLKPVLSKEIINAVERLLR